MLQTIHAGPVPLASEFRSSLKEISMTSAYVEHRPKSSDPKKATEHHVVIVNHKEVATKKNQKDAADWALAQGYVVHVARERHLQDRDTPAHWRKYP
jgi:hypothetical protein